MIRSQMFRKHYAVIAVIIILFIILGILANLLIFHVIHQVKIANQMEVQAKINPFPVFFAKLVDHLNPNDRISALMQVEKLHENSMPVYFAIVDEQGNIRYPKGDLLPFDWKKINPPKSTYEHTFIDQDKNSLEMRPLPRGLVKFAGNTTEYLYTEMGRGSKGITLLKFPPPPNLFPPPPPPHLPFFPLPGPPGMGILPIVFLILSVLLGVWMGLIILFRSLQKNALLADSVIAELRNGNLKARFPIKKMDEVGQLMDRFNQMASEIERLVEQLRNVEQSRTKLLQELAHDLRTPITSLKNILETINNKRYALQENIYNEMISLSLKEVSYFERLVEDLLLLAQTTDLKYHPNEDNPVVINELISDEIENMTTQYFSDENKKINVTTNIPEEDIEISGNRYLLQRLFRNALDNAFSFAKNSVTVYITTENNESNEGNEIKKAKKLVIIIEDDGSGFSNETLNSFGKKRFTRVVGTTINGRPSIGLGSVIMKSVVDIHHGTIEVKNIISVNTNIVTGASVKIILPY